MNAYEIFETDNEILKNWRYFNINTTTLKASEMFYRSAIDDIEEEIECDEKNAA